MTLTTIDRAPMAHDASRMHPQNAHEITQRPEGPLERGSHTLARGLSWASIPPASTILGIMPYRDGFREPVSVFVQALLRG
jgi:hypothetical protein